MTILATSFTIFVHSIKNKKKNKEGKKRIIRKTEKRGKKKHYQLQRMCPLH